MICFELFNNILHICWLCCGHRKTDGRTQQINVRFCIRDFLFLSYYNELARIKFSQMFSLQICFFFFFSFCDSLCEGNNFSPEFVRKAISHRHFPPEVCKEFTFFSMMSKVTKYKKVFSFSFSRQKRESKLSLQLLYKYFSFPFLFIWQYWINAEF